jgi:hypothetical protein
MLDCPGWWMTAIRGTLWAVYSLAALGKRWIMPHSLASGLSAI